MNYIEKKKILINKIFIIKELKSKINKLIQKIKYLDL